MHGTLFAVSFKCHVLEIALQVKTVLDAYMQTVSISCPFKSAFLLLIFKNGNYILSLSRWIP